MKFNKNYLFVSINNIHQAFKILFLCEKKNYLPIFCIKFHLINGLGPEWIKEFKNLLLERFKSNNFKILIDCKNNYGLFINLVNQKIDFLQVKANSNTLSRLKNIAKKNKVTVNPKISIVNLENIKNIKSKIQKIYKIK